MAFTALERSARGTGRGPAAAKVPVVRAEGTCTVVVLRGEADSSTRSVLSDVLSAVLVVPAGDVVIDLTDAAVIDSATVCDLVGGEHSLDRHGSRLTFRSPSPLAARMLDLFGLTELVEAQEEGRP